MSLTRLAVVRPLTVLMGLLGLVIMGGVAYSFLKIDRLPPISVPFVSVSITYTGATAQDVEQLISIPVENAVSPGATSMECVNRGVTFEPPSNDHATLR